MEIQNINNKEALIEMMKRSTSVEDWNEKRLSVQNYYINASLSYAEKEFEYNEIMSIIDCSGLIVKVLCKDASGIIHERDHPEMYLIKRP